MKTPGSTYQTYILHRSALVDYATPILGCRSRAEDIVQDAYIRSLPDDESKKDAASEGGAAYLYRIVRNLAIDFLRRSSLENRHQDAANIPWLEPLATPDPQDVTSQRNELDLIAAAFDKLPADIKTAVEMHRVGGFTMSDIAQEIGVSVPTVHRMIRQGVATLSATLNNLQ